MEKVKDVMAEITAGANRRDEQGNISLGQRIAWHKDKVAVAALVANLHSKVKGIAEDCIKTLDEAANWEPKIVAPHLQAIAALLTGNNNRMQWGAMAALNAIAEECPAEMYALLPQLDEAARAGSVITRDNYAGILIKLIEYKNRQYAEGVFDLLKEVLITCPINQLPTYAAEAIRIGNALQRSEVIAIISRRAKDEFDPAKETKFRRLQELIRKTK
ncbi:MAG: hypothetical protein V4543_13910 [Bacteroidota bacterium]